MSNWSKEEMLVVAGARALAAWLDEWVHGTRDHAEYVAKLGAERWAELTPAPALSGPVDYGDYR